ncbi:MAG: hypothetical protein ACPL5F_11940 [Moorellaceae bacterium]
MILALPVVMAVAALAWVFWSVWSEWRSGGRRKKYGVLLLTQNQEDCIEGLLREILWWLFLRGRRADIVVIDWGSRDATPVILQRFAYADPCGAIGYWDAGPELRRGPEHLGATYTSTPKILLGHFSAGAASAALGSYERMVVCDLRNSRDLTALRQELFRLLRKMFFVPEEYT